MPIAESDPYGRGLQSIPLRRQIFNYVDFQVHSEEHALLRLHSCNIELIYYSDRVLKSAFLNSKET